MLGFVCEVRSKINVKERKGLVRELRKAKIYELGVRVG